MYVLHRDHHTVINKSKGKTCWHWNNLLLFNDTWKSTVDLWITEVIPTIIFSYVIGQVWPIILYYFWAAFLQEKLEHNIQLDVYPCTSGKWHMVHHTNPTKNFGLFIPIWDIIFRTEHARAQ